MSLKKISKDQPEKFEFNDKNIELAKKMINNYPKGKQQSAVMSLLYLAQRQNNNWIPLAAMKYIAKFLNMPGACINAPMIQINDEYYEDLDEKKLENIIEQTMKGKTPKSGSYRGRVNSEPENNRTTLVGIKNA